MISSMVMKRILIKNGGVGKTRLLISVWGNDFTLHAKSTRMMSNFTNQALQWVDGLHTDCQRDMRLAMRLGFDITKPNIVLPGGGGVQIDTFYPPEIKTEEDKIQSKEVNRSITIINPRGFRAYVRNDTFFHAIPLVIDKYPDVHFICPDMSGEAQAEKWIKQLGIGHMVELLPSQSHQQMAELFRQSRITVSITSHDGTPNTLLEGMACGCFPIAGDIDSLHEWITSGMNGLLVNPGNPNALAEAIVQAISQPELRRQAREYNIKMVKERAEYGKVMQKAEELYKRLISSG
jgi:glycosyltransferase involved in cell wall biosynthesis